MNVEDLYRLLRTGHVQAQGIVDTVTDPLIVLDGSLVVQNASRSFFETFKVERDDTLGQHIYELGNGQWDIPDLRLLLSSVIPRSTAIINFEVQHEFPSLGPRTMLLTARTLFHPDNASRSILLSIVDATERFRNDAAKDMLFGEIRHRIKNLLGVAQALAHQTTTEGRSAQEYKDAFLGRFNALIAAQDLAFAEQDETDVGSLVARILAPYTASEQAVAIGPGPAIELSPRTITSLSLILHELATNAAKYGALSTGNGQVKVLWETEAENRQLRLEWSENGGPPVTPPVSAGYGTKLIKITTTYQLQGRVELVYAVDGFRAEIIIPLGEASVSG